MKRLQAVQNAAASLVSGARRRDHVTPLLRNLQVIFKTDVLILAKSRYYV